jgi:hypothetical protein
VKSSFLRPFQLRGKLRNAQRIIPKLLLFRQSGPWMFPSSIEARRLRAHSPSLLYSSESFVVLGCLTWLQASVAPFYYFNMDL